MDAGTQTVNSDFKAKIQTRAATQTNEFEDLFKEIVVQPSTEEDAVLHWFAWLMYRFVSPFVNPV